MNDPKGYIPKTKFPDTISYRSLAEKRAVAQRMREMWKNIHTLILESLEQNK